MRNMLHAAQVSQSFTQGRTRADLDNDLMFLYTLVRAVEIIGEAASRVTGIARDEHPTIEWAGIIGMRNHLVHVYYNINHGTLWGTLRDDVPALIAQLEAVLN